MAEFETRRLNIGGKIAVVSVTHHFGLGHVRLRSIPTEAVWEDTGIEVDDETMRVLRSQIR